MRIEGHIYFAGRRRSNTNGASPSSRNAAHGHGVDYTDADRSPNAAGRFEPRAINGVKATGYVLFSGRTLVVRTVSNCGTSEALALAALQWNDEVLEGIRLYRLASLPTSAVWKLAAGSVCCATTRAAAIDSMRADFHQVEEIGDALANEGYLPTHVTERHSEKG